MTVSDSEEVLSIEANFKNVKDLVLTPHCIRCHDDALSSGGVNLSSHQKLMASGVVTPNNPLTSDLYMSLQGNGGTMPQNEPALDDISIDLIGTWIAHGAIDDTTPLVNKNPTVSAGVDQTITLPINQATLSGSAVDSDRSISVYAWSQVSGPLAAVFSTANLASTRVSGLVAGTYVFRLQVADDKGATATSTMKVTVNPAVPENKIPTVSAGIDQTITLPISQTTLSGSAMDMDGSISSYAWSQVSGPTTAVLATANLASTAISGLVAGTYVFRLQVADNKGATASATIKVTVNPAVVNTATFTWLKTNMFNTQCLGCHTGASAARHYDMSTYTGVMKKVTAGNPDLSYLYFSVSTGVMPPAGGLTNEQKRGAT